VSAFDTRFDILYSQIPTDLCLTGTLVCLLYVNAFDGHFRFILKDKKLTSLAQAKEYSAKIEENFLDTKVDPFYILVSRQKQRLRFPVVVPLI
jgi:hypothetical protein